MNRKIKLLTFACILASLSLVFIQFLYLKNTYKLYQKTSLQEIKKELLLMEEKLNLDSIRTDWTKRTAAIIQTKPDDELSKYLRNTINNSLITKSNDYIKLNSVLSDHQVKYSLNFSEIQIRFANKEENILIEGSLPWFYNMNNLSTGEELTNYTLSSSFGGKTGEPVFCEIKTISVFEVGNWFGPLLNKMIVHILISTLICLFAILLFYSSIKNIVRQKKIADLKTDFVNTITHEFNTPLAALNIAVNALKNKTENNNQLTLSAISTIERQYTRLKNLVDQTTETSLEPEYLKLNCRMLNISEVLNAIIEDFQKSHLETQISINIYEKVVMLSIDDFHFTTAMNNLMDNAHKYGNGLMNITSIVDENLYVISIEDNGPGIPEEKKKYVFDKLSRLHTGNISNTNGLGLGLYYAKNIVKAHKGKLDFTNKKPNGIVFTLTMPIG